MPGIGRVRPNETNSEFPSISTICVSIVLDRTYARRCVIAPARSNYRDPQNRYRLRARRSSRFTMAACPRSSIYGGHDTPLIARAVI